MVMCPSMTPGFEAKPPSVIARLAAATGCPSRSLSRTCQLPLPLWFQRLVYGVREMSSMSCRGDHKSGLDVPKVITGDPSCHPLLLYFPAICFRIVLKDFLDRQLEDAGYLECQR